MVKDCPILVNDWFLNTVESCITTDDTEEYAPVSTPLIEGIHVNDALLILFA